MNAEPHTHKIEVKREYPSLTKQGGYKVHYGDTVVNVHRGPWLEKRLAAGIRRAIRRHDTGSIKAGQSAMKLEALVKNTVNNMDETVWGSHQIKS